jgi:hypothetical protein
MESGDKWGHHRQDLGLTVHVDWESWTEG